MDLISRQMAIESIQYAGKIGKKTCISILKRLPSAQSELTELKQEFLRMASYIDVLLECSKEQKETLLNFISKLAQYMPWAERSGE